VLSPREAPSKSLPAGYEDDGWLTGGGDQEEEKHGGGDDDDEDEEKNRAKMSEKEGGKNGKKLEKEKGNGHVDLPNVVHDKIMLKKEMKSDGVGQVAADAKNMTREDDEEEEESESEPEEEGDVMSEDDEEEKVALEKAPALARAPSTEI
jgi:hypothetical protein